MTKIDDSFIGFDGAYKSSLETLIPIRDLLPWKITKSMVYNVVQSNE